MLLGWSRAILLQLAHPLVAAGVADQSSFRAGRLAAASRLHHTVRAMLALTFGDPLSRQRAIDGIKAIHRRVNGRLMFDAGRFPAGTRYSAEDPELLLWVHATLLESLPLAYDQLVGPLTLADYDAFCTESASGAVALGADGLAVPHSWAALVSYLNATYASGTIAVGPQARELASAVLAPPFAPFVAPVAWINRVISVGLLPPAIRAQYGFSWTAADQRLFARLCGAIRHTRQVLPTTVAWWPEARQAERFGDNQKGR